jgi:diguanylate cyclase (GGDEF)-like protein
VSKGDGRLDVCVLYVEDEAEVRDRFERFLTRIVKKVVTACDGFEGYEQFRLHSPDIIVTDIQMPRVTGLEMAKKIRESNSEVPIIITTAYNESEFLVEALNNKVDYFIFKPIDCDVLGNYVQKLADTVRLRKELLKEHSLIKNILDFQKNMVILIDDDEVIEANKAFLDFFGSVDLKHFKERFYPIEKHFAVVEDNDFITSKDSQNWLTNLSAKKDSQAKVKLFDQHGEEFIFLVDSVRITDEEDETYVISFTNITDFETRSKMLEHLSYTDALTGIMNRQKFNDVYEVELDRTKRSAQPMCFIILDIDNFKNVNDTLGHDAGDTVLVSLAKIISGRIRKTDYFARWGGEEFVILLTYTNANESVKLCENLRIAVEKHLHECLNAEQKEILPGNITCSFGLTSFVQGDTKETLLKRADDALYTAKRNGKNRVEIL